MLEHRCPPEAYASEKIDEADAKLSQWREDILNGTENSTDGLDIESVEAFMQGMGLPVADYRIMRQEQWDGSYFQKFEREYLDDDGHLSSSVGMTYPNIDISLIFRDNFLEEANGGVFTQNTAVHELAHNASLPGDIVPYDMTDRVVYSQIRWGKRIFDKQFYGEFFDEGFAEWVAGRYLVSQDKQNGLSETTEEWLEIENGLSLRSLYTYLDSRGTDEKTYIVQEDSDVVYRVSGLAATAMELLIQADPEIETAMMDCYFGLRGNREFARRVNNVRPGLYWELFKLEQTHEEFLQGLKVVSSI